MSSEKIIRFDRNYITTVPAILKIVEAALCVVGFISVQTIDDFHYKSAGGWYSFISVTGFWITVLLFGFYLFHIVERLAWLPWLIFEFGFCAIWTAGFFVSGCVAAAKAKEAAWGAATVFGFLAMSVFGYDAWKKFLRWRSGEPAQGEKQDSESAEPPPPTY